MLSIRQFNVMLCATCCIVIAAAYYLQFTRNILPCFLCSIQRLTFVALAVSFLLSALQPPKHKGLWIYALINLLLVGIGLVTSVRQILLQNLPTGPDNMCMPSALNDFSVLNVLNKLSAHSCAEASPYFLGLGFSLWTLLFFSLLGLFVLIMPLMTAIPPKSWMR